MKSSSRLVGIDFIRGVAVFGVIILHADGGVERLPLFWQLIRQFFGFAVPFFLATSFYFATVKSQQGQLKFASRLRRLLYPYLLWSLLYLGYKAAKYVIDGEAYRLITIVQDPFALVFCGGATFHLYFLPLLAWGFCLIKLCELSYKQPIRLKTLIGGLIVSSIVSNIIVISGNGFQLDSGTAFSSWEAFNNYGLTRLILLLIAWTSWCLPYILLSQITVYCLIHKVIQQLNFQAILGLLILFLGLTWLDWWWQPIPLSEVVRGHIALFLGLYLSKRLRPTKWLISLGDCAFGIYLIHLIFIEFIYIISKYFYFDLSKQSSVFVLLAISVGAFVISWLITALLRRSHQSTRLILGI